MCLALFGVDTGFSDDLFLDKFCLFRFIGIFSALKQRYNFDSGGSFSFFIFHHTTKDLFEPVSVLDSLIAALLNNFSFLHYQDFVNIFEVIERVSH